MNRTEYLLWLLAEECAEVSQRASKAARFGLGEIQTDQPLTNAERIVLEINDLYAVIELLVDSELIPLPGETAALDAKKAKIQKFLLYSEQLGTLIKNV